MMAGNSGGFVSPDKWFSPHSNNHRTYKCEFSTYTIHKKEMRRIMNDIITINKKQVNRILKGREKEIIELIKELYIEFAKEQCVLPQSSFLRFSDNSSNRIIALPAYIKTINCAGIKWISSFPNNINRHQERATATIQLNNCDNGMVDTILEGSIISAKRTAAGAVAAAQMLHQRKIGNVGIVGCGRINYETLQFLLQVEDVSVVFIYDQVVGRAENFKRKFNIESQIKIRNNIEDVFLKCDLIFLATTAGEPYIFDDSLIKNDHTIIDTSLRDFSPKIVKKCFNVVDSICHVNRENTSIHLAFLENNKIDFDVEEIGNIYISNNFDRGKKPVLYSAFGLGILDLGLAYYTKKLALELNEFAEIKDFYEEV